MSKTALTLSSTIGLLSGHRMPLLGFGVYQTPISETKAAVLEALQTGYRHIDSAVAYRNEAACAMAVRASGIPRDQVFFTSKVPPRSVTYDGAKSAVEDTLRLTGFDYIDLYLIHSPSGDKEGRLGAWRALVESQDKGQVRSIGVSNYGVHHLEELEAYIQSTDEAQGEGKGGKIDVAQYELHPWCTRSKIVDWCKSRDIALQAYSPIVRGRRFEEPLLQELAKSHGKTPAQILLRWSLQMGFVPLPKSVTPSRIKENAELYDFELSAKDMETLTSDEYSPCAWDPTVWKV